jgi:alpha-amylase
MFASLLPLLPLVPLALALTNEQGRERSVYQIITDRFALTDGSSPSCSTEDKKYCGGTWKGIENKLDYVQGMGFDTVWISPVVENIGGTTGLGEVSCDMGRMRTGSR